MKPGRLIVFVTGGIMLSSPGFPQEVRPEVVRIVRQELRAATAVPIAELERLLLTRVGDPLDENLLGRSVRRLLATDLFATVEVDRIHVPGGIELVYRATKRQWIRAIRFSGNFTFLDRELRDALSLREGGDLREGGAVASGEEIAAFYRDRGYLDVKVTFTLEIDQPTGDWVINFAIREGGLYRVRAILIEGSVEVGGERLRALLRSQEGAPYNGRTFRADVGRLEEEFLSKGFYSVMVRGDERKGDEGTVDLVIQVKEGDRTELRWEGVRSVSTEALERLLTFRQERVVDEFEVDESRSAIERHYREQGFPSVVVRGHLERDAPGRIVTLTVEEGPRYLVGDIRLEGSTAFSRSRLLSLLRSRPGKAYVEADLAADVENLMAFYRGEGFLSAEVTVLQRSLDSARGRADPVLAIREGIRTLVRAVELEGTRVLVPSAILSTFRLRPGLPLREEAVEADRLAILDRYGQKGYIYAVVTTNLDFSPDRKFVRVVHTVEENHQARLHSLLVVGNQRTRGPVFRREIPLAAGDPYRYQAVLDGQQRIYQLGIVRSVRLIPLEPELEPEEVDLLLHVVERDAGQFAVAGGYSSEERLRGFVEVGHRNLWGTARSIALRVRVSEISSRAEVTYVEPWVFGVRMDGEVNLFTDFREERGYDIRRSGISLGLRREYTQAFRAALRYRLEDVRLLEITDPTALLDDEGSHTTSSLSLNPTYDTRDDLLDPSRGQVSGLTLTGAGGLLGGTDDFVKAEIETSWFTSLAGFGVLALSLRGGLAEPYGRSDRVPIHERFFAGGSNSVRGFGDKRLGPKDPGGTPQGGEAVLTVSGEFRIPLYRALGGVIFLDGGQVWRHRSDVVLRTLDDLQWAVGSGLRLKTPLGPVRLDYAYRLQEERGEDRWRIHFTLGHAF